MAEYIGRQLYPTMRFSSAGLLPEDPGDTEYAVETLSRCYGIDASSHVPREVTSEMLVAADVIVPLDGEVTKHLKAKFQMDIPARPIRDPWGTKSFALYERCAEDIEELLHELFAERT